MRVLIVEDEAISRLALELAMEESDHEVRGAGTCKDALAIAKEFQPELLLSDLGLPDGSGIELISTLKAQLNLRTVAITGRDDDATLATLRTNGCDGWVIKPLDLDLISQQIGAILANR